MAESPFAAPKTRVADVGRLPDGNFVPEGRDVPPGRGLSWIADAWAFTGEQRWTFVGVFLLFFLLQLGASLVPVLGQLAMALLSPVFWGGLVIGCDTVRRGGRLEVGHLFAGFQRHAGSLMGLGALSIAYGVILAMIMIAVMGPNMLPVLTGGAPEPTPEQTLDMLAPMLLSVLIICAVSVPVSMAFLFATPLVVITDCPVVSALKTSFFACLKNIVPFLVWGIAMLVLGIIAAIPFFLGFLLLVPVMMVSLYLAYRDIFYDA